MALLAAILIHWFLPCAIFFYLFGVFFNLLLFLALEVVCFVLISRTNSLQGKDVLSSANAVTGYVYNRQNDITSYFKLRSTNQELLAENQHLRDQLLQFGYSTDTLADSTANMRVNKENDTTHIVHYANFTLRTARVNRQRHDRQKQLHHPKPGQQLGHKTRDGGNNQQWGGGHGDACEHALLQRTFLYSAMPSA